MKKVVFALMFLTLILGMSTVVLAATINFEVLDIGSGSFQYHYSVTNTMPTDAVQSGS